MPHGTELKSFEELLLKRGVDVSGNADLEREIIKRYETDCAVLILDSSGFTRRTRNEGIIHFLSLLADMHKRVEPILEEYKVMFFWHEADNVFAVFPSALDAVKCAITIQTETQTVNKSRPPESRLETCIGIGAGKMLKIGNENIFGEEMNAASKLGEDTAEPGEILMTESAWMASKEHLPQMEAEARVMEISGVVFRYFCLK